MTLFRTLILALLLVLSLALGAAAVAAEPAYVVLGPFAGSTTPAQASAACVEAGYDGGWGRNYRDERAQRHYLLYCVESND